MTEGMSDRARDRQETGNKSSPLGVSRASAPTAPSPDPAERAGVSGPEVVVVAAARQEVRGSRQSPSGCTVHRTVEEGWGAALLSRPLDHASLHARAGVRGTGCRGGGGERRACAPAAAASSAGNSGRPEATAELAPTNCGLLASSPWPSTTTTVPGPVLMHLPDFPAAVPAGDQPRPRAAPTPPPFRTAPLPR